MPSRETAGRPGSTHCPVYLVDDDDAVRRALQILLETLDMPVQTFADPRAFLDALPHLDDGCVILDIRMPAISGLRLQERLAQTVAHWPVIVISGHGDIDACRIAFKQGAIDFLAKPIDEQDLIDAVQKGVDHLDRARRQRAEIDECRQLLATLTERERDVLALIVRGLSTRDAAELLSVSPRTIETHRANLATKLGTSIVLEWARIVEIAADVSAGATTAPDTATPPIPGSSP